MSRTLWLLPMFAMHLACGPAQEGESFNSLLDGSGEGKGDEVWRPDCGSVERWCADETVVAWGRTRGLPLTDCVPEMRGHLGCRTELPVEPTEPVKPTEPTPSTPELTFPPSTCELPAAVEGTKLDYHASCQESLTAEQQGDKLVIKHACVPGDCASHELKVVACGDGVVDLFEGNVTGVQAKCGYVPHDLTATLTGLAPGRYRIRLFDIKYYRPGVHPDQMLYFTVK